MHVNAQGINVYGFIYCIRKALRERWFYSGLGSAFLLIFELKEYPSSVF